MVPGDDPLPPPEANNEGSEAASSVTPGGGHSEQGFGGGGGGGSYSAETFNFYDLSDKKICIVKPYKHTFVLDGDLILKDTVLLLTCNLKVKGNIRGNGMIISANSVEFFPRNICYDTNKDGKLKKVEAFDPADRILIYADNCIKVTNPKNSVDESTFGTIQYYDPVRDAEKERVGARP